MKNIILNIVGQRILSEILKENQDILGLEVLYFENLDDYKKKDVNKDKENIIITHLSNFNLIENFDSKILIPIIYVADSKFDVKINTKFQKFELIYYPFNLVNFIEKLNLTYVKFQFADNSKIKILDYKININTKEIFNNNVKLKLTEREKDFLLFLKNSNKVAARTNQPSFLLSLLI